jgi:hypothetical protein
MLISPREILLSKADLDILALHKKQIENIIENNKSRYLVY